MFWGLRFWKRLLLMRTKDVKTPDAPPLMYLIPQEHVEQVFELWDESRNDPESLAARYRLWNYIEEVLGGKTNLQSGMRWQLRRLGPVTIQVVHIPDQA